MGWYLYGIAAADGVGGGALPDDLDGIEGSRVRLHGDGDLRLVVSATDAAVAELVEADPDRAVEAVRRHDEVLTRLARILPVLPVRFGTVLPDDDAAATLAEDADGRLRAALGEVAGADEWVVRVDAVAPDADSGSGAGEDGSDGSDGSDDEERPGHAFFARKRAAADARVATRRDAATTAAELHLRLGEVARASRPLDARDPETVARHAYLVERTRADDFLEAVGMLDGAGEVQGPLPAYHFADGALA